ncbi:hypothetical protein Ddye_018920 [Dipteronia dyeriana]|uniref:RNase H type-1 domain-containing protein n=1 Tax=Dipteronia dyeriana TaxID=168575 RepID=A0AAD9WVI1_9ROSI|nr:hypothetical protein Ddye_018920 [Dipteronia dyeriana]
MGILVNPHRCTNRYPPPPSCLKLNTDVVRIGSNLIGVGVAIRDASGRVLADVSVPMVGVFSVELGEMLALKERLLLAKRYNLRTLVAEVDATNVVYAINSID